MSIAMTPWLACVTMLLVGTLSGAHAVPVPVPAPAVPVPSQAPPVPVPAPAVPVYTPPRNKHTPRDPAQFPAPIPVPAPAQPFPVPVPVPAPAVPVYTPPRNKHTPRDPAQFPGQIPVPAPAQPFPVPVPAPAVPAPGVPSPVPVPEVDFSTPTVMSTEDEDEQGETSALTPEDTDDPLPAEPLSYYAISGCRARENVGLGGSNTKQCFDKARLAGAKCCALDGTTCDAACLSDGETMTFEQASARCDARGKRLCSTTELANATLCCGYGHGCYYRHDALIWSENNCTAGVVAYHSPQRAKLPQLRMLDEIPAHNGPPLPPLRAYSLEPARHTMVTYGCSHGLSKQHSSEPIYFSAHQDVAGIRCCALDGGLCISLCHSWQEKVSFFEAQARCAAAGARLCSRHEMLDSQMCCASTCGYDSELVWTNQDRVA